jgi:hypothetical protein
VLEFQYVCVMASLYYFDMFNMTDKVDFFFNGI